MKTDTFVEVNFKQHSKFGQTAAGDVFMSNRLAAEDRLVCVLADGLGSGVKANVLATMTSTMAMKYITSEIDIKKAAEIIMSTLPVCSKRKIGYSTFSIIDVAENRNVKVIEYDNPGYVLIRNGQLNNVDKKSMEINTKNMGRKDLLFSSFQAKENDLMAVFTDGVTQSGLGTKDMPLGWTNKAVSQYVLDICRKTPDISADKLAARLSRKALQNDSWKAKDDISCAVINFRQPRKTLVLTGPPYHKERDKYLAQMADNFEGRKIICGGTTAVIIARELNKKVEIELNSQDLTTPPASNMKGFDLVTEGTITLSKVVEMLEKGAEFNDPKPNAAKRVIKLLLDSDIIKIIVGTRINDAHQDPNLPAELDIRRNLIRRLIRLLNEKYIKEAQMELI